ncbi:GET complex subunit get1 [Lodderomyces elongisporus]|uniref:GET complex subunit get1 n=1 Tax=Lodderomyces elongisporus TaxID=36914 RepID=UPI00291F1AC4|nr:GET complex subunit get1 [Lodderomyces elongisporus]WLF77446.1 GET complex subunit get1 [Lodderomyces elongisporus]
MLTLDIDPYTILVTSFLILAIQKLVTVIGKQKIQLYIWQIYTKYLSHSQSIKQFNLKQKEIKDLTKQQKSISAQDEYAKWTKINRALDKLKLEVQELNETIAGEKTRIDSITKLAITLISTLPIWFLRIFCRKTALLYIRKGILPAYLEWWLALPFFKSGTIGLTCWMFVVNSVLSNLIFLISFPFTQKVERPIKPKNEQKTES